MREIKFRAWDKERKDMRDVALMDWSDWWVSTGSTWERGNSLEYGERNSFKNEETDRHIIMQYTGLKDKNGKEIYEGDIVCSTHPIYDGEKTNKNVIEFDDYCWRLVMIGDSMTANAPLGLYARNPVAIAVVGNIYENPELAVMDS